MKRISTILFSLLFLNLSIMTVPTLTAKVAVAATASAPTTTSAAKAVPKPPVINAGASVLMDSKSGEVLYSKNMNYKYGPASTTKIMTALLTLENCKLEDVVVVGKNPPFEGGSKIYIIEGEKLTIEQMMYGLMLTSGNDVANALAEHISGSVKEFAKLMTKRAKELGCLNTNFSNANGLKNDNHYTSAYDLALITKKAMESPIFRKVVSTVSYQIPPTNKQKEIRYLHNHNKMLSVKIDKYPGADGVKTGYTIKSKYTYVGSATRNGRTLIAVFLFDNKGFYKETANLFNYGFKNFYNKMLYTKTDLISTLKPKGTELSIPVYPEKDIEVTLKKDVKEDIVKSISINNNVTNIKKGDVVGTMTITYEKNKRIKANLVSGQSYSKQEAEKKKMSHKLFQLSNLKYLIFIGLIAFFGRGFYRKYKRKGKLF